MKKLLSLLGSMVITGVTVGTVIACASLVTKAEAPENLNELLEEISTKIKNDMEYWFKEEAEYFIGDKENLKYLTSKVEKADGKFPISIPDTSLNETITELNIAARDIMNKIGKELLFSSTYAHLFTGLEEDQIIETIELTDLAIQDFDIVKKVEDYAGPGYEDILDDANAIKDTFQISGNFKIHFNFVIGDSKNTHITSNGFYNTYLTSNLVKLTRVMEWLKTSFPNIEEELNKHVLTYKGHNSIEAFDSIEKLYAEDGDILKILNKLTDFEPEKLEIKSMIYETESNEIGTATSYKDNLSRKAFDPKADIRGNPMPTTGSIIPYVAGYNGLVAESKFPFFSDHEDSTLIDDLKDRTSFVDTLLYGSIDDVQTWSGKNDRNNDPILTAAIPGILSFDKKFSQSFIAKSLEDESPFILQTNLETNVLKPIQEFYDSIKDYSFSDNIPKDQIMVQEDLVILGGADAGVLTKTNISDFGKANIFQWFYDGVPLSMMENLNFLATPTNNISLEKLYGEILDYAYDMFIQKIDEEGMATSLLNNMFTPGNYAHSSLPHTFYIGGGGSNYSGANVFILNPEDFDNLRENRDSKSIMDAVNYVLKQQNEAVKENHEIVADLSLSISSELYVKNDYSYNTAKLYDGTGDQEVLHTEEDTLLKFNRDWIEGISNIENNIILNFNGIKFAINNYNLWQTGDAVTKRVPRWNLGTTNFMFMKSDDETFAKAKYTGNIWEE
ncbi:lipoprotein [Spiroplasma endosymbiont of Anurida maritima]|uniref:lipoprotein n=1 Tax=Spiroplasma endosymbiont of Anurida maritima TaxID=2967972 RepID=UPI0036D2107B